MVPAVSTRFGGSFHFVVGKEPKRGQITQEQLLEIEYKLYEAHPGIAVQTDPANHFQKDAFYNNHSEAIPGYLGIGARSWLDKLFHKKRIHQADLTALKLLTTALQTMHMNDGTLHYNSTTGSSKEVRDFILGSLMPSQKLDKTA